MLILVMLALLPPVRSQPPLSITVSTNKTQYSPGATVSISGVVRDNQSNPVLGASVSIQVNDPGNNIVQVQLVSSDQSGAYLDPLSLPMNAPQGLYTTYVSASRPGYANGQSQTQFTVVTLATSTSTSSSSTTTTVSSATLSTTSSFTQTTSSASHTPTTSSTSSSSTTNATPQCLIATATFGSELVPEVALLRNFRDFDVLQTSAGAGFMRVFNAFYYSFSPGVASFIISQSIIRAGMKIILYPLIGILYLSSLVFAATSFNGEVAVTVAGVFASFGIGVVYLGPILAVLLRIFKSRSSPRCPRAVIVASILGFASVVGLCLAEFVQIAELLEITTVGLVLSSMALGGLLASWKLMRIWSHGAK